MKRWSIAAAAAGVLTVCLAVSAQAAEFCLVDPPVNIQTSPGESFTVYVTEGVLGSEHLAALERATISYTTTPIKKKSVLVTVYENIPSDSFRATFATMMIVSSQPFGHGVVYGSSYGTSGSTMSVSFRINPQQVTE
jgi:hypothetical protein